MSVLVYTCCGKLPGAGAKFCVECGMPVPAAGQSETPKKRGRAKSNKDIDMTQTAHLGKLNVIRASKEVQLTRINDMITPLCCLCRHCSRDARPFGQEDQAQQRLFSSLLIGGLMAMTHLWWSTGKGGSTRQSLN